MTTHDETGLREAMTPEEIAEARAFWIDHTITRYPLSSSVVIRRLLVTLEAANAGPTDFGQQVVSNAEGERVVRRGLARKVANPAPAGLDVDVAKLATVLAPWIGLGDDLRRALVVTNRILDEYARLGSAAEEEG